MEDKKNCEERGKKRKDGKNRKRKDMDKGQVVLLVSRDRGSEEDRKKTAEKEGREQ